MADLRYPIGPFVEPATFSASDRTAAIRTLAELPARLRLACAGLADAQLDTPYRTGGWTVKQVVHHIADSHVNSDVRHKLTITEKDPPIKAYDENAWAQLADANAPIGTSLRSFAARRRGRRPPPRSSGLSARPT